jgi:hypothetical protein
MKLYHGTSARHWKKIQTEGILPRANRGTNYVHNPSSQFGVYLSNAYALYYALNASKKEKAVVVEVDTTKLFPILFCPDEDFLEQVGRGMDGIEGDMYSRTTHYRDRLEEYMGDLKSQAVALSLKHLGNCCYMSRIPLEAITRVAFISRNCDKLVWSALDPSIVIANYTYCGHKYRNMLKWIFEEPLETTNSLHKSFDFEPPSSREGVLLKTLRKGAPQNVDA